MRIRADLDAGRDALAGLDLTTVDAQGGIVVVVDRAADHIEAADHRARTSAVLGLLHHVPGVRGQIDALRDLTGVTAEVAGRGREVAAAFDEVLDLPPGAASRLQLARTAATQLADLGTYLDGVELGADGWLVPPLAWARDQLHVKLIEARADIGRAGTASDALAQFLTGPRRYLIVAGNNAEMRSGGVITASGVAQIADGDIDVGEFLPNDARVAAPAPVPVPQEWHDVYAWRSGDQRYPGTTYTPNFPVAARIISEITARNQHGPVEGVLYVDVVTLRAVLSVVGPVVVEGVSYDAGNVVQELLYENYLTYGELADNDVRKELQGAIASAAFQAVSERDYSVFALAGALADMATSRHLLGWADDPAEQDLWEILGVDGHLEPDDVMVELGNLGSSKLDYFVTVAVDVTTSIDEEAGVRRGRISATVTNPTRTETSNYVEGFSAMIQEPGEHVGWLLFFVPQYATYITPVGFDSFSQAGPDGPLYVAGTVVHVPEGESRTYSIDFTMPIDQYILTVLPSARIQPTTWRFDGGDPIPDYGAFDYDLETGEVTPDDRSTG